MDLFSGSDAQVDPESEKDYTPIQAVLETILPPDASVAYTYNKGSLAISFFNTQTEQNRSLWITMGVNKNNLKTKYSYCYTVDSLIPQPL